MSESDKNTVANANTTADVATRPGKPISATAPASVKDSGKVHIGGGMMRF
jgi:hypothetical protein